MNVSHANLWVGAFVKTGAIIVYDPELQILGPEWVVLYSLNLDEVCFFEKTLIRNKIRPATRADYENAIARYELWHKDNNGSFGANTNLINGKNESEAFAELQNKISTQNELIQNIKKEIDVKNIEILSCKKSNSELQKIIDTKNREITSQSEVISNNQHTIKDNNQKIDRYLRIIEINERRINKLQQIADRHEPISIEPEPKTTEKPFTSCRQCGGDGGAGGRCPRCGGNGFEPES